jgi:hypothetical protein
MIDKKDSKYKELIKYSDPVLAQKKAKGYLGDDAELWISNKPDKKYMIFDNIHRKFIHFGQMGYEDFTRHKDVNRRNRYLTRTSNMRGEWRDNPYSANNLSREILW